MAKKNPENNRNWRAGVAKRTLLFGLFVSFVCVAAAIGAVPGNSGGLASSGAIRRRSEGGKRQKKCGMKTRLAHGDVHQQKRHTASKLRCVSHLVNAPPLWLSPQGKTHTHTWQLSAGNYKNHSQNRFQNGKDNCFWTKSDCLKVSKRVTQTKVWIPESVQMWFWGEWLKKKIFLRQSCLN